MEQVHPRSRGEYLEADLLYGSVLGSPPLTRGIPLIHVDTVRRHRFTPAHAGNTISEDDLKAFEEVHPRSRGEYYISITGCAAILGSPPLTRGIH